MNLSRPLLLAFSLILAAALIGVWAYLRLPADAQIPVHFSASGVPNGYTGKGVGLFLIPAVAAGVILLVRLAVLISPFRKGLGASSEVVGSLLISLAAVFLATEAAIVARAFDPAFDVLRTVFMAVAALLVVLGNVLGKLRHNYVLGIRTPWTLANDTVWDKTHRFTGRLMFLAGLALLPIAAFTPDHRLLVGLMVLCAAGPAVAGAVYSRLIYPARA